LVKDVSKTASISQTIEIATKTKRKDDKNEMKLEKGKWKSKELNEAKVCSESMKFMKTSSNAHFRESCFVNEKGGMKVWKWKRRRRRGKGGGEGGGDTFGVPGELGLPHTEVEVGLIDALHGDAHEVQHRLEVLRIPLLVTQHERKRWQEGGGRRG